jgi:hypothetical protein
MNVCMFVCMSVSLYVSVFVCQGSLSLQVTTNAYDGDWNRPLSSQCLRQFNWAHGLGPIGLAMAQAWAHSFHHPSRLILVSIHASSTMRRRRTTTWPNTYGCRHGLSAAVCLRTVGSCGTNLTWTEWSKSTHRQAMCAEFGLSTLSSVRGELAVLSPPVGRAECHR